MAADRLEVLPSLGSGGALKALSEDAVEIGVIARPLTAGERSAGLRDALFARTLLVFVTSHPKPDAISRERLPDIFSGTAPKWSDGTPQKPVLRPVADADSELLKRYFPGLDRALDEAHKRSGLPVAITDQDNAETLGRIEGSFGQAGLSQLITEGRKLNLVTLDGVRPTLEALASGAYPYQKQFWLVWHKDRSGAAERLLAAIKTYAGQQLLRAAGCLPAE